MSINIVKNKYKHGYHLVDLSPWPLLGAFSAFIFLFGAALYLHGYILGNLWKCGLFLILLVMYGWWRDVTRESTLEGQHTTLVQRGLRIGVLLFILSEVMFFFGFFWAFFHSSFNPNPSIGGIWPPAFIVTLSPWKVPLLNTIILLSSGASVTWTHHALVAGFKEQAVCALTLTILLAILFTFIQVLEYITAEFYISDGIYGSVFYMATGFHGIHVFIGTCFLTICLIRLYYDHFTRQHHFGFEAAAWYWHFVDVVWLFLFITIYWWGS